MVPAAVAGSHRTILFKGLQRTPERLREHAGLKQVILIGLNGDWVKEKSALTRRHLRLFMLSRHANMVRASQPDPTARLTKHDAFRTSAADR
jgi:hypothetical protein